MVMSEEEIRYFCRPIKDGRILVVSIGVLDDLYQTKRQLPYWTFALTKEYLNSFPQDRIVFFQQEFDFD